MSEMFLRAEIAARLFDTPLLMHGAKAEALVAGLGDRLFDGGAFVANPLGATDHVPEPQLGVVGERIARYFQRAGVLPFDVVDGVAIIPIEGTLIHKGAWIGAYSGATSYQGLQSQIAIATRSDEIKGIVFEVDSFGGQVFGVFDTAEQIRAASDAKPTMAILTSVAASAGYLLASQARQIVMPEDGQAGSIGAVILHRDASRHFEQEGVKITILRAGEQKTRGNPFERLPDDLAARWLADLEGIRSRFAAVVAEARPGRITADEAIATEADIFNSADSLDRGLVDAVGRPADAFQAFVEQVNRAA